MAQRYGGGSEDFRGQADRLAKLRAEREAIIAKEVQGARAADALGEAEGTATARTNENTRARREQQDVARRTERTAAQETAELDANSAAIQRNTAARERAASAQRAQTAVRGARDPLLAQAQAISGQGGGVRQYRQQLGIGYTRASKLATTLDQGFRPSGDLPRPAGPLTRTQGLQVASERAEADYQAATRELTNVRRRQGASDADRLAAVEQRDAARAARDAARLELESARSLASARAEATVAVQQVAARERAAADASRALIVHPTASTGVRTHAEAVGQTGAEAAAARANTASGAGAQAANAERAYLSTLTRERREYIAALNEQATLAGGRLASASGASNAALQREAAALGTVSQAMHKHGALTSEFILASARGESTLKELGNQALITAGKFGGWTAAATGLYAAAGAIGQVGKGALDASSGVNQLERVIHNLNPDDATKAFASLSREFNVPIETAVDAVYRMGQRFHSLPEAVEAARASLYSFKTGEVDVASSSKNLLAIVSGFGLSASDLSAVYDQINQAQNTFGIGIQDTEEGLAKAGGAYRNAGGDLDYLLGLFVAIGKQTGQTGNVIGTGIARAVSQIRIPSHIDALKALGIDVDPNNLQKTIQSAIARARSGALKPADQNRAASAIFGNQYARLFAPILRDQRTLDAALKDTSGQAAQGSANRELQTTLHSAREEIAALGNGLQRLGDQLARAGAFNLAGALLKGMDEVLNAAEDLLRLYNEIPQPLREGLTLLLEMGAAIKVLQRFGALEGVAGGVLGNPAGRLKTRAVRGARDFRDNAFDESESAGQRSAAAANAAERARRNGERLAQEAAAARTTASAAPSEANTAAAERANERVLRAEAQHARLAARSAQLAEEANDARAIAAEADAAYVETQKVHATQMRRYVAEQRRAIPVETDVPSTRGVEYLPASGGGAPRLPGDVGDLATRAPREMTARARAVEQSIVTWAANTRGSLHAVSETNVTTRAAGRAVDVAARGLATGAGQAVNGVSRAAGTLRGARSGLTSLAGSLGALDVVLIGLLAGEALNSVIDRLNKDLADADHYLQTYQDNTEAAQRELKARTARIRGDQGSALADAASNVNDTINPTKIPSTIGKAFSGNYESAQVRRAREQAEAAALQQEQAQRQLAQKQHENAGTPIPQLTYDQLNKRVESDANARREGLISQREFDRRMANHAVEAKILLDPTKAQVAKAKQALSQALSAQGGNDQKGFAKSLRSLSDQAVDQQMQSVSTELTKDNSSRNVGRLRTVYNEYKKRYGRRASAGDPRALQALAGARDSYYNALTQQAQNELALAQSRTADPLQQATLAVSAASKAVTRAKKVYGSHSQQYRSALTELNTARQQQAQAIVANVEADNALLEARAGNDPVAQANAAVQAARNTLDALNAHRKKVDPNSIKNAQAQLINAQNQQEQAQKDQAQQTTQLEGQLAQAQAGGDPVVAAQAAQRSAKQALAAASTRLERLQALVDLENANNDLQNAIKDREDARYQYLESLTDDPAAQAGLEVQRTKAAIKGTQGASRYQALAAYNQALKAKRDADLQAKEDDIDFELQMGRISTEDAIDRYNALLKTRNLTKQQKQDIQERVKQLQDQTAQDANSFDLDVSSLKLPTIYDVRKAFDPIRRQARQQQQDAVKGLKDNALAIGNTLASNSTSRSLIADVNSNVSHMYDSRAQVQAQVIVHVNDASAAESVYSAIDRAMKTTVKAKMKSRRHR